MLNTPNSPETQGPTEGDAQGNAKSKAWGKVPEDFVRNQDVNEATLVLTAYRSTFSKSYVLREGELLSNPPVKRNSGLGRDAIRRTIARMRALCIIKREQRHPDQEVEETLTLEVPTVGFFTVWRRWFDAGLSLKAMAAWLYLLVGTRKGPVVWAREIRDRFGWDPKTCGKVVRELDEAGRLTTSDARGDEGRYRGFGYQAEKWEKPVSEKPVSEKSGDILRTAVTDDLPTNPLGEAREASDRYYAPHASREDAPPFSCELNGQISGEPTIEERTAGEIHYTAIMDKTMLGWIDEHTLTDAVFDGGPYEEHLEAVCALTSETELRQRLLAAAGGRIGRRLLAPEGLHTARWLAAALVREPSVAQEAVSPDWALEALLEALAGRIGRRPGQWLNSWELIGHRLAANYYTRGEIDGVFAEAPHTGWLTAFVQADQAGVLSKKLRRDSAGLDRFLDEQARLYEVPPHKILAIMKAELAKQLIDGKPIYGWRFFATGVADELHRDHLEAEGIRPGDLMGAHKRRG